MGKEISVKDKYKFYEKSVQCIDADVDFINQEFEKFYGRKPNILREDFGGTGALACEWARVNDDNNSYAIDLDPEPIGYGKEYHWGKLNDEQKGRVEYIEGNVLGQYPFKSDVTVAFNFSYFIFKKRKDLLEYFKKVREGLKEEGMFAIDLFGGTEARQSLVEETEHANHSYFWDCDSYNPLTNECLYYIHFKVGKKKYKRVFTYDWRHWTMPELVEIMEDAGFREIQTYWEGEDGDGGGDGKFFRTNKAENCESWVSYICALP